MQELCVTTFYIFPVPLTSLRQLPSISLGYRMKIYLWVREIAEEWTPKAVTTARASPALQPTHAAGALAPCFSSGCRFAHTRNSSGRVCTYITLQYSVLTAQGFELPSAQRELGSGDRCTRASQRYGNPGDTMVSAGMKWAGALVS